MRARLLLLREKDTRRLFGVLLAGKMLGVVAILGAMWAFNAFLSTPAGAAEPVQQRPTT